MRLKKFELWDIGDGSTELGVPRSNLRYFIDIGKIPARRSSSGSRLLSPKDMAAARKWLAKHAAEKERAKLKARQAREAAAKAG
jgi:hypothetical protein